MLNTISYYPTPTGEHIKHERIAVIVSSPDLDAPQLLGVLPARSSKAADQEKVIIELIEDWNIKDKISALCFDTTASNTGVHSGVVVRIERYLGQACLWSACLRHVNEVHMKHGFDCVFGPTSGPSEKLFKELKENWGCLKDSISYTSLSTFNWDFYKGTELEIKAIEAQNFCRRALSCGTFPREDYQELASTFWCG